MKNILKLSLVSLASLTLAAGCIQETFPQTSYVTTTQAQVPGAIDRFVDAITATLCGFPNYGGGTDANDFGYRTPKPRVTSRPIMSPTWKRMPPSWRCWTS